MTQLLVCGKKFPKWKTPIIKHAKIRAKIYANVWIKMIRYHCSLCLTFGKVKYRNKTNTQSKLSAAEERAPGRKAIAEAEHPSTKSNSNY